MPNNDKNLRPRPGASLNDQRPKDKISTLDFSGERASDLPHSRFEMIRRLRIGDRYRPNGLRT